MNILEPFTNLPSGPHTNRAAHVFLSQRETLDGQKLLCDHPMPLKPLVSHSAYLAHALDSFYGHDTSHLATPQSTIFPDGKLVAIGQAQVRGSIESDSPLDITILATGASLKAFQILVKALGESQAEAGFGYSIGKITATSFEDIINLMTAARVMQVHLFDNQLSGLLAKCYDEDRHLSLKDLELLLLRTDDDHPARPAILGHLKKAHVAGSVDLVPYINKAEALDLQFAEYLEDVFKSYLALRPSIQPPTTTSQHADYTTSVTNVQATKPARPALPMKPRPRGGGASSSSDSLSNCSAAATVHHDRGTLSIDPAWPISTSTSTSTWTNTSTSYAHRRPAAKKTKRSDRRRQKSVSVCYNCGKLGHIARECRRR